MVSRGDGIDYELCTLLSRLFLPFVTVKPRYNCALLSFLLSRRLLSTSLLYSAISGLLCFDFFFLCTASVGRPPSWTGKVVENLKIEIFRFSEDFTGEHPETKVKFGIRAAVCCAKRSQILILFSVNIWNIKFCRSRRCTPFEFAGRANSDRHTTR